MSKPTKQIISYPELLNKVQSLLVRHPDCRNIRIDRLEVYQEQLDGANWHIGTMLPRGDDSDLRACRNRIIADIELLRRTYDVIVDKS